jgi:hypothetical protein
MDRHLLAMTPHENGRRHLRRNPQALSPLALVRSGHRGDHHEAVLPQRVGLPEAPGRAAPQRRVDQLVAGRLPHHDQPLCTRLDSAADPRRQRFDAVEGEPGRNHHGAETHALLRCQERRFVPVAGVQDVDSELDHSNRSLAERGFLVVEYQRKSLVVRHRSPVRASANHRVRQVRKPS